MWRSGGNGSPGGSAAFNGQSVPRNELVIRMQPKEAIYMKTNVKSPGLLNTPLQVLPSFLPSFLCCFFHCIVLPSLSFLSSFPHSSFYRPPFTLSIALPSLFSIALPSLFSIVLPSLLSIVLPSFWSVVLPSFLPSFLPFFFRPPFHSFLPSE